MYGGQDVEINNAIGSMLLEVIPDGAQSITAVAEVLEDWAKVKFEFHDAAGVRGTFSMKDYPRQTASAIGNALIDLRNLMAAESKGAWTGVSFTVDRENQFSLDFSYDEIVQAGS